MLAIFRFLIILTLGFSLNASALQISEGRIGVKGGIKIEDLTPGAVIMKDGNNNDVLLVFYRTQDRKKKHQVAFSIARTVDDRGMLIWDQQAYILPDTVFNTGNVAPLPIIFNKSLYLLGTTRVGHNRHSRNRVQYTQFASLDDLINGAVGGNLPAPNVKTLMDTNRDHNSLTGTVITGTDGQPQLLVAYYHTSQGNAGTEQPPFSYALCDKDLQCTEHDAYRGLGHDGITSMTLYNMRMSGEETILMAVRHSVKHTLVFSQYHPEDDSWIRLYAVSHLTPDMKPIALVERNNQIMAYYNNDHYHNSYTEASIMRSQVSKYDIPYSASSWLNGISLYNDNIDRIKSDTGISAVAFKGNVYGFYKDKYSPYGKYFREMD